MQVLQSCGRIMTNKERVILDSRGKRHVIDLSKTSITSESFVDDSLGKESAIIAAQDDPFKIPESYDTIRPQHYGGAGATYEVFNVLEAWELDKDFYLGNVIKYVARAGKKDPSKTKEDLEKALVYLQRRIDSLK